MFYNKMIFISITLTSYYYLIISVQQTIFKKPLVNSCCLLLMSFLYISRFIYLFKGFMFQYDCVYSGFRLQG